MSETETIHLHVYCTLSLRSAHGTFPPHLNHDLTPSLRMREAGLSLVQSKVDENRTEKIIKCRTTDNGPNSETSCFLLVLVIMVVVGSHLRKVQFSLVCLHCSASWFQLWLTLSHHWDKCWLLALWFFLRGWSAPVAICLVD